MSDIKIKRKWERGVWESTGIVMRSLSGAGLTLWSGTINGRIDRILIVNFESVKIMYK